MPEAGIVAMQDAGDNAVGQRCRQFQEMDEACSHDRQDTPDARASEAATGQGMMASPNSSDPAIPFRQLLLMPARIVPLKLRSWLLLLACAAVVPLAVALWLAFEANETRQQAAQVRLLRDRALSAVESIERHVELGETLVRSLARLHGPSQTWSTFDSDLKVWLDAQGFVSSVEVVDGNGSEIFRSDRHDTDPSRTISCGVPGRGPAKASARTLDGSASIASSIQLLVPLDGRFSGCTARVSMPLKPFSTILERKPWPPDWIGSLVDPSGRVAARSVNAAAHVGREVTAPLRAAIAAGSDRSFVGRSVDGIPLYAYVARLPGHDGWHVAVGAPLPAVDKETRDTQRSVLFAILVAFVFTCSLALLMAWQLAREVRSLLDPQSSARPLRIQEVRDVARALQDAGDRVDALTKGQARSIATLRDEVDRRRHLEGQLKAVQHRLLSAQELERKHLSRELHDELGQDVAILQLMLRSIEGWHRDSEQRSGVIAQCMATVERLAERVRSLSIQLRPPQLDDIGLASALRSLARRVDDQGGTRVTVEANDEGDTLGDAVATALYRIAQSALTNALRHARARSVMLRLDIGATEARVVVQDDGEGFDVGEIEALDSASHLGLHIMHERVEAVGGSLEIVSGAGRGTRICAVVPRNRERAS